MFHNFPVLPFLNPQEDDAKFFGRSKKAEDGPSRADWLSKMFPEVPNEFRVSCGKKESLLIIPRELGYSRVDCGT